MDHSSCLTPHVHLKMRSLFCVLLTDTASASLTHGVYSNVLSLFLCCHRYCKCELPYNPDRPMIMCDMCEVSAFRFYALCECEQESSSTGERVSHRWMSEWCVTVRRPSCALRSQEWYHLDCIGTGGTSVDLATSYWCVLSPVCSVVRFCQSLSCL